MKIAANAVIANARAASINQLLITKLESKMKIFGKKDVKSVNILALKNGSQLVISAELPEKGVECAAVGAAALEAGEYEMKDGKILVVDQNGVIVEIKEPAQAAAPVAAEAATEEIVEAVVASVNAKFAEFKAEITAEYTAKIEALTKATSAHVPAKGTVNNAPAKTPSVHAKVNSVVEGIREGIVKSRKA
jgi:tRNA(Phe) wybutosine-synthesizing methylase Tyw3